EADRVRQVDAWQRTRVARAKDEAARTAIVRQAQAARSAIADEAIARLVEDYDNGAVLDFYFADQLRDVSASGFDLANFLGDMINGFDPAQVLGKRSEVKDAHDRASAARKAHPRYSSWLVDPDGEKTDVADSARSLALTKSLKEVETLLQTKDYA